MTDRDPLSTKARTVPYGYCECGCGQKTSLAPQTQTSKGWIKGEPCRFVAGHKRFEEGPPQYTADPATGCWQWFGDVTKRGYGRIKRQGRKWHAHRWYYEQANGPIPEGLFLDHLCRNRLCVNPDHLEPVTHTENVRRGAATKLDAAAVRDIRSSDIPPFAIAAKYGVTHRHVVRLRRGIGWEDITP